MGIKDLLRFMKPYTESVHIEKYGGKRVGIDAYSWLHKGAYSCSMELCLDSESDSKFKYINYFMHRIDMLRHYNVIPVVVFDGGNIPCKAATENERYRRRKANRELAMERLKEGNVSAATELFQRAVSVTTSMAHQLIQTLRGENVEFMVAPYEADAQLAYLSSLGEEKGGIVAVITEDSDLLAYGCSSVIFKMDKYGNGEEIMLEKVFSCTKLRPSFQKFNKELFTGMCVLAGCDFLPSITGIGIGKAHSLVLKYYNIDRVLSVLKFQKGRQMPEDYLGSFRQAVAVFQHARVYDKITKRIEHIRPPPKELLDTLDELDFLGPDLPPSIATAISEGNLDPLTMEAYSCSQNSRRYQSNPTFKQSKSATTSTTEASCFELISSQRNKEAKFPSEGVVERQVLKEWNYSYEAAQLAKIVPEIELPGTVDKSMVLVENSLKITKNDSCKKSKHNEAIFDRMESNTVAKQLAAHTSNSICDGDSKIRPSGPGNSMLCDKDQIKTPDNNPFKRKFNQVIIDVEDNSCPESCVTEVEIKSNIDCLILDSQESVNSKSRMMKDSRKGDRSQMRLKNSNCKNSGNSTILDFFSHE